MAFLVLYSKPANPPLISLISAITPVILTYVYRLESTRLCTRRSSVPKSYYGQSKTQFVPETR